MIGFWWVHLVQLRLISDPLFGGGPSQSMSFQQGLCPYVYTSNTMHLSVTYITNPLTQPSRSHRGRTCRPTDNDAPLGLCMKIPSKPEMDLQKWSSRDHQSTSHLEKSEKSSTQKYRLRRPGICGFSWEGRFALSLINPITERQKMIGVCNHLLNARWEKLPHPYHSQFRWLDPYKKNPSPHNLEKSPPKFPGKWHLSNVSFPFILGYVFHLHDYGRKTTSPMDL